jgi:hypothetical protein
VRVLFGLTYEGLDSGAPQLQQPHMSPHMAQGSLGQVTWVRITVVDRGSLTNGTFLILPQHLLTRCPELPAALRSPRLPSVFPFCRLSSVVGVGYIGIVPYTKWGAAGHPLPPLHHPGFCLPAAGHPDQGNTGVRSGPRSMTGRTAVVPKPWGLLRPCVPGRRRGA